MAYMNGKRITFTPKLVYAGDYNSGYLNGLDTGHTEGYTRGYEEGYDAGFYNGDISGYARGFGQGTHYAAEQAQNFGARTNYTYWKAMEDITGLKIPCPMKPINCSYMFSNAVTSDNSTIDLSQYDIDFSLCPNFAYWLNLSAIGIIGVLDTTCAADISTLLYNAQKIITIKKLILKEDGSQTLGTSFGMNNFALQNINEIIGEFGNSFGFTNNAVLTHDTLVRILEHLKDYSGTSKSCTLTIGAANKAKLSDTEKAIATEKGWTLA
jgi:hypothetical protein